MQKAKIVKRVENLKKIRGIAEISKFDALRKLSQLNKVKDHHYEIAKQSVDILSFARRKYRLSSLIDHKIQNKGQKGKLWIYITITSGVLNSPYGQFEKLIKDRINPLEDKIVAVGHKAITFAEEKGYKILHKLDDERENLRDLVSLVNHIIMSDEYKEIVVVANTPKIKSEPYKIYPITETPKEELKYLKKTKFYFSIIDSVVNISNNYIENILKGIYEEAYMTYYKEKFVRHEGSIKNIDERISYLKSEITKTGRKNDTESMIQSSQVAKRNE